MLEFLRLFSDASARLQHGPSAVRSLRTRSAANRVTQARRKGQAAGAAA